MNDVTVSTWLVCAELESDNQTEWMVGLFMFYLDKQSCSFVGTHSTSSFPAAFLLSQYLYTYSMCVG